MACSSPLKLWYDSRSRNEDNMRLRVLRVTSQDVKPEFAGDDYVKCIDIPCGQCIGCRLDYSRRWADRLMLELQLHDEKKCWFVTLTYDDDHIDDFDTCLRLSADPQTGEIGESFYRSLNVKNLQDFMKRLRYACYPDKIRFFAAGEYGETSGRPHYHLILFNCDLERFGWDQKYLSHNLCNQEYKSSLLIQEKWPFGFNVCAPVTWKDCAYVSRYILKKQKGEGAEVYKQRNIDPPFTVMSRKPGIAREYYDLHPESVCDKTFLGDMNGKVEITPPKYFREILNYQDPEEWLRLVERDIKTATNFKNSILKSTTKSKAELNEDYAKALDKYSEKHTMYRKL